jgi:hypothetical protein
VAINKHTKLRQELQFQGNRGAQGKCEEDEGKGEQKEHKDRSE